MKVAALVLALVVVAGVSASESNSIHRLKREVLAVKDDDSHCVAAKGQCVAPSACNVQFGSLTHGLCPGATLCCIAKSLPPATSQNTSPHLTTGTTSPSKAVTGRRATVVHLLMGLGDQFTSPGVLTQATRIRALGADVTATVWTWAQWQSALSDLQSAANSNGKTKHVVIGYSNGASMVQQLAASGVALDLLIAEDPTIWLPTVPLKGNVKKSICFHNTNWMSSIPPVGHASLVAGDGFNAANLQTIDTTLAHTSVDTDPSIIQVVVNAVQLVVNAP